MTGRALGEGRDAFARRAWADAYGRLVAARAGTLLGADDLERLATAAYLTGHGDCAEIGYLLVPDALMVLGSGDPAAAGGLFDRARAVGRHFGETRPGNPGVPGSGPGPAPDGPDRRRPPPVRRGHGGSDRR